MRKYISILENSYFDSVSLMALGAKIKNELSLEDVQILMGTDMNKDLLITAGYPKSEVSKARANDCIIALVSDKDQEDLLENVKQLMFNNTKINKSNKSNREEVEYHSLAEVIKDLEDVNLLVISTPGEYAYREANKALDLNKNVLIFSDNMAITHEKALKEKAATKGLLVMGPDCGTSIINNKGICFANEINQGSIGLIGASGTGLQETTVLIDRMGGGITHAIGVGGRDLSNEISGLSTLTALSLLDKDPSTEVIVIVSKPPSNSVVQKLIKKIENIDKQVILCFIDYYVDSSIKIPSNITFAKDFVEAATLAVQLAKQVNVEFKEESTPHDIRNITEKFSNSQKYIRALYCGGTLAAEAFSTLKRSLGVVKSNLAKDEEYKLQDSFISEYHAVLDLGEDEFTLGKPHPMIDPTYRNKRIIEEAGDSETAIILLDFELGYGSHEDPIGVTLEVIEEAQNISRRNNNNIQFIAYILGTDKDYQGYDNSRKRLEDLDVIVTNSNRKAIATAMSILKEMH